MSSSNGQQRLDAYLNKSQSNGINSFINLTPDFNDATMQRLWTHHDHFLDTSTTDMDKIYENKINNNKFINNGLIDIHNVTMTLVIVQQWLMHKFQLNQWCK